MNYGKYSTRIRLTRSRSNCDVMKHKVMEVIVQRLKDIDVDMNHKEKVHK